MNNPYQVQTEEQFVQSVIQASGMDKERGQKKINDLAKLQVSTPQNAQDLVNHFSVALQTFYPSGMAKYGIWRPVQDSIYDVTNPPDPKKEIKTIVAMFQAMKKFAVDNSLAELSDAVTQSAYWYWKNIEQPSNPSANLAKYGTSETDPAVDKAKKREKRAKFIKWGMIGGSALIGMTMIYFAFFHNKDESKRKSNPKRISSGVGVVTSGRVRKRNRKAPVKVGLMKSNPSPVLPKASSLAEYRKKFDQEKKMKAIGDHKPATKKAISKKPATKSRGLRLKK